MEGISKLTGSECVDIFYEYFKNREDNEINNKLKNLPKDELSDLIFKNIEGENSEKAFMCKVYITDKKGTKFNNEIIELANQYLTLYPQGNDLIAVLKILVEAYISEYEIEKALEVCEMLYAQEYEYIHSYYCDCLYKLNRLDEAVSFLEARLVIVKEKYGQDADEKQLKIINSVTKKLEKYKNYVDEGRVYIPTTPKGRDKLGIDMASIKKKGNTNENSTSRNNFKYTLESSADTDTFVAFDFETTGFKVEWDEITEIGAVKVVRGKVTDRFTALVNPHRKIKEDVVELTGITNEMVVNAPEITNVMLKFIEFIEGFDLIGHNIVRFDVKFLDKNLVRIDKNIFCKIYDTEKLARKYFVGMKSYKLTELSRILNIEHTNAHRALSDAETTAELYMKCFNASI
ncbi:exonuclease domain-containing protein [Clostridium chromiireducens]|uniref:exonuclease domain-containing protein n=1 Tax=Clostridium chromiireducens TaxID=225345 RepID=UPI003AF4E985